MSSRLRLSEPTDATKRALPAIEVPIRLWGDKESTPVPPIAYLLADLTALKFDLVQLDLRRRTSNNADAILSVVETLSNAQQRGSSITPAASWLLDNHYLVEDTAAQIRRDLPARYSKQLPVVTLADGRPVPRALLLAWAYVAQVDSAVSIDGFEAAVATYQEREALTIGELWALPSLLRFVLIENLRRLAVRVRRAHETRVIANEVADEALRQETAEDERRVLSGSAAHARDTTFATQLLFRLRDGTQSASNALAWLEAELETFDLDAEEITRREHSTLSSGNVTTGNIIKGLRIIDSADWTRWFESLSRIDCRLRENTDFAALDFHSRDQYRRAIEVLARGSDLSQSEVTEHAIEMARVQARSTNDQRLDIGGFVVGLQRPQLEREIGFRPAWQTRLRRFYTGLSWVGIVVPAAILTGLFLLIVGLTLEDIGLSDGTVVLLVCLFVLPAVDGALGLFNMLVSLLVNPDRLIGYEYKDGIPETERTLVVLPVLIGSRGDVDDTLHNLEIHYLSNKKGALNFALLSDWPDSSQEHSAHDAEILEYAKASVASLNERHPFDVFPRFHLLHRRRIYSEVDGIWMGWERKRGKLQELNALLRGDDDTTFLPPAQPLPNNVQFVMTLDADTRMTRDAVTKLVGKLAHPLNRPRFDTKTGRVTAGHGILQPRVTPSLTTGEEASFFQRVVSAHRGMDPYVFAVSDVYQDLFDSGTFTGKGLYHIDAMEASLRNRIPENTVLSHDLLEGAYARAALVSDVELIEDYPTSYAVDSMRQHRWIRGDWQLLPFIFRNSAGIPGLSRWKMLDNLRRSLTPISWVAASIAGWSLLPFAYAAQWQALLVLSIVLVLTYNVVDSLVPRTREATSRSHLYALARESTFATAQVILRVVPMAHQAWLSGDAIVRTLFRLFVSRRHMLEWRTASEVSRSRIETLPGYYRLMVGTVVIAVASLVCSIAAGQTGVVVAGIYAAIWIGAPAFAWFISRSAETDDRLDMRPKDAEFLRVAARRTWYYFETFVTQEHNNLPPDNFQVIPEPVVAHRTSPTNIGLYLLSVVSARDFGWISMSETERRLDATMTTMESMRRHRGHLYNWYDTKTLEPLPPLYVSSVDSGNLAGHLIAIAAACEIWAQAPVAHLQSDIDGILDNVTALQESLTDLPNDRRTIRPVRQRLRERIEGMRRAIGAIRDEPEMAPIRIINLSVLSADICNLAQAIHEDINSAESDEVLLWARNLQRACQAHLTDAHTEGRSVASLRRKLVELQRRARTFAFEMQFSFLMRADRKLLSIGYRVEERQLDESCYDLLASEARLASLFAIAKGDLPTDHWMRLGRPVTLVGLSGALVSWAGSMFEYLMPPLVMKEPLGGILNQTNNQIIKRQIWYARAKGIPWGISESAYNARDRDMTYQYMNFGVPGLGLKRDLALNIVVAPYATFLAAQFKPRAAVANLIELKKLRALGRYGYFDALDFTPMRLPAGTTCVVVQNYLAHHQGMSIVAVANAVFEGRMRDRFHSDAVIEAAELLLQEKAPRDVPATKLRAEAGDRPVRAEIEISASTRVINSPGIAPIATSIMSNGFYSLMLTSCGTGYSRGGEIGVTRWNPDLVDDSVGTFLFVADAASGDWWSATALPKNAPNERTETVFGDDMAIFTKHVGMLQTKVECVVAADANGEARRITIKNGGGADRNIEVTSFGELTLATDANDQAHPAFSKMFVITTAVGDDKMILARRNKRAEKDADIALAHFVTASDGVIREVSAETDRRVFLGRGRTIGNAAAFDHVGPLGGHDGYVLDPVMALRCRVKVPAGKEVALTFWTLLAATEQDALAQAARFNRPEAFERQAMLSWTRSQVQTLHVALTLADAAGAQRLARYLIYPDPALRAPPATIAEGLGPQSALWPTSISGDFPIFVLRISDIVDIDIVAGALRIQEYLRARGMLDDLVIINEHSSSYAQDLQQSIEILGDNSRMRGREFGPRQHIFTLRRDLMDESTYRTLLAVAHIVLHTRNGPILNQIERAETLVGLEQPAHVVDLQRRSQGQSYDYESAIDGSQLQFWNTYGGFAEGGKSYVVRLDGSRHTPHPWINVIANERFGFHVSAEGAAFTWCDNSRDFQLTPWSNDPVLNRCGEGVYIADLDTGEAFSPVAALLRDPNIRYEANHTQGVSRFTATRDRLETEWTQLVDPIDQVKISRLRLTNDGNTPRRIRVYVYAEWVLGPNRSKTAATIIPEYDSEICMMTARNPFNTEFGTKIAFLTGNRPVQSVTADRSEFLGRSGSVARPKAVLAGNALSDTIEAGRDPCSAIAFDIDIPAGSTEELVLCMGAAESMSQAAEFAKRHRTVPFDSRLVANSERWTDFAQALQISTPDSALDVMINRWLPYQSLSCRINARVAFYQASGAFGFRDQLQDTLSLLLHDASLARRQILNAASRQFREGDVQHWWLPESGAGVRTTISDDVVWLAHATHRYLEYTGDLSVLDENVHFIDGPPLADGQHDAFFTPTICDEIASLYEHCAIALDLAVRRTGPNGLPLILGGDWNDGMNRVGENGRGESVWLGWFLAATLRDFAVVANERGDTDRGKTWIRHTSALAEALEKAGWDGAWYRRGYFDDGSPLGSHLSQECQIDSLSQSWAVLSGVAPDGRAKEAMKNAWDLLVDKENALIRLFTPPFELTKKEPGYIKGYPPGVRENGGQYTHAAAWFVLALAKLGRGDDAYIAFNLLNPINHALDEASADEYRVEPYVVAADVYSHSDKAGRGGWTWYTGSAGWLYRAAVEGILGISRTADKLVVKPCMPSHWDGFEFSMRIDRANYSVRVERGAAPRILIDDVEVSEIELAEDGHREIVVTVGPPDENPVHE